MKILLSLSLVMLVTVFTFQFAEGREVAGKQAVEVGLVSWQRDFSAALAESKKLNRPILALFQEVPGCHGCKAFGRDVLSDGALVKRIEDNFIPVLIYNNKGGKDAKLLKQFGEPSWNFQVIRFLDHEAKDIIPRRDKVWTLDETNSRIDTALAEYQKNYSTEVSKNNSNQPLEAAFAQHCFWTGEMKLGAINGVQRTEAGFYDGQEVTRVWFDGSKISREMLTRKAKSLGVARTSYLAGPGTPFSESYSKAKSSDQKKQLENTIFENLEMTNFQKTKVNAFARQNPQKALTFLNNEQREQLSN